MEGTRSRLIDNWVIGNACEWKSIWLPPIPTFLCVETHIVATSVATATSPL